MGKNGCDVRQLHDSDWRLDTGNESRGEWGQEKQEGTGRKAMWAH